MKDGKGFIIVWIIFGVVWTASALYVKHLEVDEIKQAHRAGYTAAMEKIPSALLVNRPKEKGIVPWGFDGKPGVDVRADDIAGGGLFVNMQPFKSGDAAIVVQPDKGGGVWNCIFKEAPDGN